MADPIHSIRILGNGLEAWLAAHILNEATIGGSVAIEIQPLGAGGASEDHYTILRPSALASLEKFGLTLQSLLRLPSTLPSLGQVLRSADGVDTAMPYGGSGIDWAGTGFHHHWLRARRAGLSHPYFAFSPGYHAMATNRFAPPDPRNAIGPMQHESGLHVSPQELTESLRLALDGQIAILKPSASAGAVDFVIHAYRPDIDLPPSQLHAGPPKPYAVRYATPDRPRLQVPLRSGWLNLATETGPARRHHGDAPWRKEGVAIGLSAGHLPGLEDRAMDRLLFELEALLSLWPRSGTQALSALEYNRLWTQEADEWAALSALVSGEANERCQARRALFSRRGYIEPLESATITPEDWVEAFIARGIIPTHYDPLSERLSDHQLKSELQKFSDAVGRTVGEFPDFPSYLRAIDQAIGSTAPTRPESPA